MIQNEKVIQISEAIFQSLKPSKIILFGSQAQNPSPPNRDIDLLIVYDGKEPKRDTLRRIHNLFPHPDFSLDVFLLRSDEFQKQIQIQGTLGHEAFQSGVMLYG